LTEIADDSNGASKRGKALTVVQSPSLPVSTSQSGNTVLGHMGGRDVNVYAPSGNLHITQEVAPRRERSVFRKLFDKLEQEVASDKNLTTYIRQLEVYTRHVDSEEVIGLEQKFQLAGRASQLAVAVALKESVYSDIKANVFSPTYQLIVATLMSKIHERFVTDIRPLIEAGGSRSQVDKAFSALITVPIASELDDCPQFEDVAVDFVRGMTFFLTGNCHIRWD
jgi:hypothetical protein